MIQSIKSFYRHNRAEFLIVSVILIFALVARLYRIGEYMTFLGDEGRDVRIVRDLITQGNLVFIGPQTSVGNMYLGPLYYYMMAPALLLSGLNPVGPAIMIALIGVCTIWFTWYVARVWFGKHTALFAASLYAVSPVAIIYSKSSWNPNPMPFFALLSIWGIYQVWRHHQFRWIIVVGIALAFALQMHYLGLLLIPTLAVFWLITFYHLRNNPSQKFALLKHTAVALGLFLLLMSPLLLFDIRHNWMNFNAFKSFFSDRQTTVNLNPARSDRFLPVTLMIITDLVMARQSDYVLIIAIIIFFLAILVYYRSDWKSSLQTLFVWLGFAILGLSVYKQHVYIHYMGFIYPAVYLMLGAVLGFLYHQRPLFKIIALSAFIYLLTSNLYHSPLRDSPNRQLSRTISAVDSIIAESKGQPFNFGLIAKQNYDESYRYFFEIKKANLVRGETAITDQLFVICEDGKLCQPEGNPQWQIASFGPAHITNSWQIDHLQIYRLVHNQ